MTIKNITLGESADNNIMFNLPINMEGNLKSLINIKKLIEASGSKELVNICTDEAKIEIESEESALIKEAVDLLQKSKDDIKNKFPVRSKILFWKTVLKNPIKTLLGLCLRSSKYKQ